ncbi:GGDEF domain-containing protein [Pseudomonas serbica]|uniref:GGDEF domain-containing protein n=1 Tax=Pseudomonas serbica TaxID=2965074 RepID=UPI00237C0849|nr:GGDEF domain-containing protein [Pseudomonas serbica]
MLISGKPHKPGVRAGTPQQERELLRDLARKAEQELIGVQMASMDEMTLLPNRHGFIALAQLGLEACNDLGRPATLLFFNLDEFKRINYLFGRTEGDKALKTFADVLRIGFRESDVIGRLEGATFVALLTGSGGVDIATVKARLEEMLDERMATAHRGYEIRFSIGQIEHDPTVHGSAEELLVEVEKALGH